VSEEQWRGSYQLESDTTSIGLANVDVEEDTAALGLGHFDLGVCKSGWDSIQFRRATGYATRRKTASRVNCPQ